MKQSTKNIYIKAHKKPEKKKNQNKYSISTILMVGMNSEKINASMALRLVFTFPLFDSVSTRCDPCKIIIVVSGGLDPALNGFKCVMQAT